MNIFSSTNNDKTAKRCRSAERRLLPPPLYHFTGDQPTKQLTCTTILCKLKVYTVQCTYCALCVIQYSLHIQCIYSAVNNLGCASICVELTQDLSEVLYDTKSLKGKVEMKMRKTSSWRQSNWHVGGGGRGLDTWSTHPTAVQLTFSQLRILVNLYSYAFLVKF